MFVGKEVVIKFRWGDRVVYGATMSCIVLGVEQDAVIVRGLQMDAPGNLDMYPKLERHGRMLPVEGEPDVFRIPRDQINTIFEVAMDGARQ